MIIECDSIEEGLMKVAQFLGAEILSESQNNLKEYDAIDTGQLLQSGSIRLTEDGCVVSYDINYADYIEYGTDPHWVPIEPLIEWARHKGKDESFAYIVQKKIAKYGTDPKPYMRDAIDKVIHKYSG